MTSNSLLGQREVIDGCRFSGFDDNGVGLVVGLVLILVGWRMSCGWMVEGREERGGRYKEGMRGNGNIHKSGALYVPRTFF